MEREVAKWFYLCRDNIKSNKPLMKVMKHVYQDVLSYYYNYNYNALTRTVSTLGKRHIAEKTKGWIGIQMGYILEMETLVKQMEKDDKFPDKKTISKRFKDEVLPLKAEVSEMIKQVFKCEIPGTNDLKEIKPISQKVTPLEPKNIRVPPTEAPNFQPFLSEKVEGLKGSLNLFVNNKKDHVEKSFFDLKEKIRDTFTTYNIELLKSCGNMKDIVMNDEFKNKHQIFKEMNGGKAGYYDLNQKLDSTSTSIEQINAEITKLIQNEASQDQSLARVAGKDNITSFSDANKGEMNQLKRIFFLKC